MPQKSIDQITGKESVAHQLANDFPAGTKYLFEQQAWIVYRAYRDSGTEWREIHNSRGDMEVVELHTLQKDFDSLLEEERAVFFQEPTATELLMIKAYSRANPR